MHTVQLLQSRTADRTLELAIQRHSLPALHAARRERQDTLSILIPISHALLLTKPAHTDILR